MAVLLPLLLVSIFMCPLSIEAQEYYVTPTPPPNPDCPSDKPCHTLSYYSSNAMMFNGQENVTLLFLDGTYEINSSLDIEQVHSLTISAVNNSFDADNPPVVIRGNLGITSVLILTLAKIYFNQSRVDINGFEWFVNYQTVYDASLTIIESKKAKGILIDHSKFLYGNPLLNVDLDFVPGFDDGMRVSDIARSTFEIRNTIFLANKQTLSMIRLSTNEDSVSPVMQISDSDLNGFGVFIYAVDGGTIYVNMNNCSVRNNINTTGVVVSKICDPYTVLTISNSTFVNNDLALQIDVDEGSIMTSEFVNNRVNGYVKVNVSFSLQNVSFRKSSIAGQLVGQFSASLVLIDTGKATATIDSCLFEGTTGGSSLFADSIDLIFAGNATFNNNHGTNGGALMLLRSKLWLKEASQIRFINNTASGVGGAIWVEEDIETVRSSSQYYSGIKKKCFYQLMFDLLFDEVEDLHIPMSVIFEGNKATNGGDDIYGVSLKTDCVVTPDQQTQSNCRVTSNNQTPFHSYEVQDKIFQFLTPTLSYVSGSPKRVCVCNNTTPDCATSDFIHQVTIVPGEKFNISLVVAGNDFGITSGGVYDLIKEGDSTFMSPQQEFQQVIRECRPIEYLTQIANNQTTYAQVLFTTDIVTTLSQQDFNADMYDKSLKQYYDTQKISTYLLTAPVLVNITILPCPLGTAISKKVPFKCECFLPQEYIGDCTLRNNSGLLHRNGTIWIGRSPDSSYSIVAYKYCPFDYCIDDKLAVDPTNSDTQCALNRSGVLCGGCPPNLSLAIGSSRCIHCPNNNGVALLVVFIVAGIVLVLFIKLLDLTVAHGTINGLIFYVNIIWINQGIFFPLSTQLDTNLSNFYFLCRLFIAWLNLDFGIETCFIQGLGENGKHWLQFVFPVYLWLIAALIVVACHYSTRVTKLFGNNAVAVLTTLFLLSYVKLLRTVVLALGAAPLEEYHPDGSHSSQLVWSLDGNFVYFAFPHALLIIVAFCVLIFLGLPYTLLLLCVGQLNKLPCVRISRLAIKSRPLLDTYTGPLKNRHQYWVGLTLLVRVCLVVTAAFFQTAIPIVNVNLVVLISAILCSFAIKVYRKKYLFLLEFTYLLNLIFLGVVFLSIEEKKGRIICTCVSVAIGFLVFALIIAYHMYKACPSSATSRCCKSKAGDTSELIGAKQDISVTGSAYNGIIDHFHTTTSIQLRESLLETN